MFPPGVPDAFERDYGSSPSDWQRNLAGAVGEHPLRAPAPGCALVAIGDGRLMLQWHELPPLRLGLVQLPRLRVAFRFEAVAGAGRQDFMRRFDLWMQRGGG